MKTICINGVELDLNMANADTMERFEIATDKTRAVINASSQDASAKTHEKIRLQCGAVCDCFDEIFGNGTSEKVIVCTVDYEECINALMELIEGVYAQQDEFSNRMETKVSQYSPNRAARRATAKK